MKIDYDYFFPWWELEAFNARPDYENKYLILKSIIDNHPVEFDEFDTCDETRAVYFFKRRVTRINNLFRRVIKEMADDKEINLLHRCPSKAVYRCKVYFYTNGRLLMLESLQPYRKRFWNMRLKRTGAENFHSYLKKPYVAPDLKPIYPTTRDDRKNLKRLMKKALEFLKVEPYLQNDTFNFHKAWDLIEVDEELLSSWSRQR